MYIDKLLMISQTQDLGGSEGTGTIDSDYSIDLGAAKDVAKGTPLYVVVTVDEAFSGGTSVDFQVITDSVEGLSSSVAIGSASGPVVNAALTLNREAIFVPIGSAINEDTDQYLGLRYDIVGTFTAGKVSAHIGFEGP